MKTKEIDGYTLPDVDVKLTINDDANARVYEGISDKGSPFAIGFIGESKKRNSLMAFVMKTNALNTLKNGLAIWLV